MITIHLDVGSFYAGLIIGVAIMWLVWGFTLR